MPNKQFLYKFIIHNATGKAEIIKYRIISGTSKGFMIEIGDKEGKIHRKFVGKIKEELFAYTSPEIAVEHYLDKLEKRHILIKEMEKHCKSKIKTCKTVKKLLKSV